jgi:hypothetical protein
VADLSGMKRSRFGNSFSMPGHPRDRAIAAAMSIARKYKREHQNRSQIELNLKLP